MIHHIPIHNGLLWSPKEYACFSLLLVCFSASNICQYLLHFRFFNKNLWNVSLFVWTLIFLISTLFDCRFTFDLSNILNASASGLVGYCLVSLLICLESKAIKRKNIQMSTKSRVTFSNSDQAPKAMDNSHWILRCSWNSQWTYISLVSIAILEELVYRRWICSLININSLSMIDQVFWVLFLSFMFGLSHVYWGIDQVFYKGLLSFVCYGIYIVFGSIIGPLIAHSCYNFRSCSELNKSFGGLRQ